MKDAGVFEQINPNKKYKMHKNRKNKLKVIHVIQFCRHAF